MIDDARNEGEVGAIEQERLVDRICDAFESAIKVGGRPDIATYLRSAPAAAHKALLTELLQIAIEYAGTLPKGRLAGNGLATSGSQAGRSDNCVGEMPVNGESRFDTKPQALSVTPNLRAVATQTDPELSIPKVFGDFDILKKIGRGGMGTVFAARQRSLNRIVALKVLNSQFGSSQQSPANDQGVFRFQRESTAAARQDHENIVTVFQSGVFDGRNYVAMQLIEGPSLRDMIIEGPLPNRRAAQYLLPVCRAVHRMHGLGVIHRDLKPSNILVEKTLDKPYVADFGLAKLLDEITELTLSGEMFGSLSYMPPEQVINARNVGAGADVYGIGATLYHLLTGRPPFQAASVAETIGQIVGQLPVAPRQINPAISQDLDTICLKCLEKDPRRRYASAKLLADDLARYLEDRPIVARPPTIVERLGRWSRQNRTVAICLLVAFLSISAIAVGSGLMFVRESRLLQQVNAAKDETQVQLSNLCVANAGLEHVDRLGMGLTWLAETVPLDRSNPSRLKLDQQRIKSALASYPDLVGLGWHDHALKRIEVDQLGKRFIVGGVDDYISVWNAGGAEPIRRLRDAGQWKELAISPDGQYAATGYIDGSVRIWDVESATPIEVLWKHDGAIEQLRFSPDSQHLVTCSLDKTARVWDLANRGAAASIVLTHPSRVTSLNLDGSGTRLITGCWDGSVRVWETATGKLLHGPMSHGAFVRTVQISSSGEYLLAFGLDANVSLWDVTGKEPRRTELVHPSRVVDAVFTGDSLHALTATGTGTLQLWNLNDGTAVEPKMNEAAGILRIIPDRDGARAAVVCKNNTARVWGLRDHQPLTPPILHPELVHDARFLSGNAIVTAAEDCCHREWRIPSPNPVTGATRPLTVEDCIVSPNGLRVAIQQENRQICVMELASGGVTELDLPVHASASAFAWNPDGIRLEIGSEDGSCRTWNCFSGSVEKSPMKLDAAVTAICCSDDGRYVAAGARNGGVSVLDSVSNRCEEFNDKHVSAASLIGFAQAGGRLFAVCGPDVFVWSVSQSSLGPRAPIHLDQQQRVIVSQFLGRGDEIVTASLDGQCTIWNSATGEAVQQFSTPGKRLHGARIHSNGALIATFGTDRTIRIWDLHDRAAAKCSLTLESAVVDAVFSPENAITLLLKNGEVTSWDLKSGEMLGPPVQVGPAALRLVEAPSGASSRVLTEDGSLVQFDQPTTTAPIELLSDWCRLVSGHRVDPQYGIVPLRAEETRQLWTNVSGRRK